MNKQVVRGNGAEIEVVSAKMILERTETANEVHLTIKTEQKPLTENRQEIDMTNAVVVRLTDITVIRAVSETIAHETNVHETIAHETINTDDEMKGHHPTVHRRRAVIAQMDDMVIRNHTIKNPRSTRKSPPNGMMAAQTMIVTSRRKRRKVNGADLGPDELHALQNNKMYCPAFKIMCKEL